MRTASKHLTEKLITLGFTGGDNPRIDDVAYWLREKYYVFIEINNRIEYGVVWWWGIKSVFYNDKYFDFASSFEKTYDDALEKAVIDAVELIENDYIS